MSRVTVLVAAYNAEKYLEACLDSLAAQTLKDIQIVCIDDASTDSTLQILQRYAAKDSRIQILQRSENAFIFIFSILYIFCFRIFDSIKIIHIQIFIFIIF